MKKIKPVTLLIVILILLMAPLAMGQRVALVSVNSAGTRSGNEGSANPVISSNGRYVVFGSSASDLVAGDIDDPFNSDVFVRDLVTGTTRFVSADKTGAGGGNAGSYYHSISANGRYVVFSSRATNLVQIATNFNTEVFVRDLIAGTTTLVSVNKRGTSGGNSTTTVYHPAVINSDGRFIAFESNSSNLVDNDFNDSTDVFLRDIINGTTKLVSINSASMRSANGDSFHPVISANGQFVAFESRATNLVGNDTNGAFIQDVFVRDMATGTTKLVSINNAGTGSGNDYSFVSGISDDGRFLFFLSYASDLVGGDTNNGSDVFMRDLVTDTTQLVSVNAYGTGSGDQRSSISDFSPDGRFVAFSSDAGNLVANDTNGNFEDAFIRDLVAGTTTLVSVNRWGTGSDYSDSSSPSISDDGRFVTFVSEANELVANDDNGLQDVFVRDLTTGTTNLVSANVADTRGGNARSALYSLPVINSDGRFVAFGSDASNLVANDANKREDVFAAATFGGTLQFSAARYRLAETDGNATITVNRVGGSMGAVKVRYTTYNDTASAGQDYTATTGILSFANSEASKTFTISVNDDALDEANEVISIKLSNATGGALIGARSATLNIIDNDLPPAVSINDAGISEGDDGTTNAIFMVTLSTTSGQPVTVKFATANGTAIYGRDYISASGTLSFAPGQTTKMITIQVKGDTLHEANEIFRVNLSAPHNATIADGSAIGTILNDD